MKPNPMDAVKETGEPFAARRRTSMKGYKSPPAEAKPLNEEKERKGKNFFH